MIETILCLVHATTGIDAETMRSRCYVDPLGHKHDQGYTMRYIDKKKR